MIISYNAKYKRIVGTAFPKELEKISNFLTKLAVKNNFSKFYGAIDFEE